MPTSGYHYIEAEIDLQFLEEDAVDAAEMEAFFSNLGNDTNGVISLPVTMYPNCPTNECTVELSNLTKLQNWEEQQLYFCLPSLSF